MPGFSIQITSDTVTPKLLKGTALIKQAIADQLETSGQQMEDTAKQIVHVRTGFLRSTIYHKVDPGELTLEVGAGADYAFYLEMGTRRSQAYPFLRPAVDAHSQDLTDAILFGIMWAFQ